LMLWVRKPTIELVSEYNKLQQRVKNYEERIMKLTEASIEHDDQDDKEKDDDDDEDDKPLTEQDHIKYQERLLKQNYFFAIIFRRSDRAKPSALKPSTNIFIKRMTAKQPQPIITNAESDPFADQFISAELMISEANRLKLEAEEKIIDSHISDYETKYNEMQKQIEEIDNQAKVLMEDYKKLKKLKKLTFKRKDTRNNCRILRQECQALTQEMNSVQERYERIDQMLQDECDRLSIAMKRIIAKRKDIPDMNVLALVKLDTLIKRSRTDDKDDMNQIKKKKKSVVTTVTSHVVHTATAGAKAVKNIANTAVDTVSTGVNMTTNAVMGLFGAKEESVKTENDEKSNDVAIYADVDIHEMYPCMYELVDGFLFLVSEPLPCICWISRSQLTDSDFDQDNMIYIAVKSIKQITECKFAKKLDIALMISIDQNVQDHKRKLLLFGDDEERCRVFDAISHFISSKRDGFKLDEDAEERTIVNQLLWTQEEVEEEEKEDEQSDNRDTNTEKDEQQTPRSAKLGFVISNALRKKFANVLQDDDRLILCYGCHESTSMLPGNLYLFTHSLCYDTSFNSDGTFKVTLPIGTDLNKITCISGASAAQNGIKISDEQGRTYYYTGFDDHVHVFSELCNMIRSQSERDKSYQLIMHSDTVAVISRSVRQLNEEKKDSVIDTIVSAPTVVVRQGASIIGKTATFGIGVGALGIESARKGLGVGIKGISTGLDMGMKGLNLVTGKKKKKKATPIVENELPEH
jgi:hypothetical protein